MESIISQIVKDLFSVDTEVHLTRPNPSFGDFATNVALEIAGQVGLSPRAIAEKIAIELQKIDYLLAVEVAGPGFINLRVSARALEKTLQSSWGDAYGSNSDGAGKIAVVEYPSPNMAKPYSVGHLRSGNQGWAVKQLLETTGWKVITDDHLGDYGAPFGVWVTGFLRFSSVEALEKDGVYELGRVYIKTRQALKDEKERGESELADEVQQWLIKLENGDQQAIDYSTRFNKISLDHIHNVMARLKISTDYEMGEAFFAPRGKEAVQKLLDSNVAVKNDDNSIIVPLDDYGFDVPLLVQKSNGAALYATTDLATILYREANWHPDKVIYCVGAEQQFYFTQLFAMAKKLGIKTELYHLWFGTIDQKNDDGTREKMSSRKGVILMDELLDQAEARAKQLTADREVSDEDVKKIALGAIKFSDFAADRRTNILFDWESIFALSGFSGPYIQYAAVRVNKILQDNSNLNGDSSDYDYEAEKAIIIRLLEYPEVVKLATRDLEPHKVASFLYELARDLNRYYETTRINESEADQKWARVEILKKVSFVIEDGLRLLGIEVPARM